MSRKIRRVAGPLLLVGLAASSAAAAETPSLDLGRAVRAKGVVVPTGAATLRVEDALVVPRLSGTVPGREFVLLGRAIVEADAPDEVEARYLETFTGNRSLREETSAAVAVLPDPRRSADLLRGAPETLSAEQRAAVEETWAAWLTSPERRGLGVDLALARADVGDPTGAGFSALWCRAGRFGSLFAVYDPSDAEPSRVGRYVPPAIGDDDLDSAARDIRRQQRRGRSHDVEAEDLGDWDDWMQWKPAGAADVGPGFQTESYEIDLRIVAESESIDARARLGLSWVEDGRRAASFELSPDLVVRSVTDAAGRQLAFRRWRERLIVIFPDPGRKGESGTIEIRYRGAVLERDKLGYWWLRSTGRWYPRGGAVERATYDVTLRHPKRLQLFAAGRRVAEGGDGDEVWERRVLEAPSLAFSFEVGSFDVESDRIGNVEIVAAFGRSPERVPEKTRLAAMRTIKEAVRSFQELFGSYPYPTLTIVTVPREFSQGYPSFVSFSHLLLASHPRFRVEWKLGEAEENLAHEIAHQWWGNKVGWAGYRDQWLSEALANFSAIWFTYYHLDENREYLTRRGRELYASLAEPTGSGRPVAELGPVVLGRRLDSSLAPDAYDAIVYDKGALVFNTLVEELGEAHTISMLRKLADAVGHRVIDTNTFFTAMSRLSGRDLGPFVETFVKGTIVPELDWKHESAAGPGGDWIVSGTARISAPAPPPRWVAVRRNGTGWDVRPTPRERPVLPLKSMSVPWRARLDDAAGATDGPTGSAGSVVTGSVTLEIPEARFEVHVPRRPASFELNPGGILLGSRRGPVGDDKPKLVRQGEREIAQDHADSAEDLLRKALAVPPGDGRDARRTAASLDARAHLALARVVLSRDHDDGAREELAAAERELVGTDSRLYGAERDVIKARLDLRAGRFDAVYDRLSRRLYLPFLQRASDSISEQVRRAKFSDNAEGTAESYSALAIAAYATGRTEVGRLACDEARKRGADLAALDDWLAARGATTP